MRRRTWAEIAALLLILTLAAYLRLANNADNPGWYSDEGTHLDIAQNLARGRTQYLAINQSTLLFSRLPLFEMLLAGWLDAKGGGIGALRALTGVLGVISVGTLYLVVRRIKKEPSLALLSTLMLAIYPQAILYSRFGLSYNLLTPLVLLTFLGLWEYLGGMRRGWLALAALAIGIGGVSDLWMFALVAPMMLVVSIRRWRDLLWSVPLLLLPFGLYAVVMLLNAPQAFLFDLDFIASRLSGRSPAAQLTTLAFNYAVLVSQDHWIALAIVGLFLLRPVRLRRLSLLMFLFPIIILGRTVALFNLSFYYMIPLLPFVGLGMATVIQRGASYVARAIRGALLSLFENWGWVPDRLLAIGANLILFSVVISPFLVSVVWSAKQTRDGFSAVIDPFLIDPGDARRAAEFVNNQADADDVIVASPALAWLFLANVADFQMTVAAAGQETPHLPADIPADRFVFDPDYRRARFVVVDNLWRNWAVWNVIGVSDIVRQVETWPLAFKAGEIEVYCNPVQQDC
jgi:4-amino-4-deoxy-L-arabinose transferase-like glycosyltransferase